MKFHKNVPVGSHTVQCGLMKGHEANSRFFKLLARCGSQAASMK